MDYFEDNIEEFDFTNMGREIKAERERRGLTREQAAEIFGISESYLKAVENTGIAPGFQVFYRIMTTFSISVDKYFFPDVASGDRETDKSLFLKAHNLINEREAGELYVLISTMDSMKTVKEARENEHDEVS